MAEPLPAGAIVGIVLGVIGILLLLLCFFCYWRYGAFYITDKQFKKRKSTRKRSKKSTSSSVSKNDISQPIPMAWLNKRFFFITNFRKVIIENHQKGVDFEPFFDQILKFHRFSSFLRAFGPKFIIFPPEVPSGSSVFCTTMIFTSVLTTTCKSRKNMAFQNSAFSYDNSNAYSTVNTTYGFTTNCSKTGNTITTQPKSINNALQLPLNLQSGLEIPPVNLDIFENLGQLLIKQELEVAEILTTYETVNIG